MKNILYFVLIIYLTSCSNRKETVLERIEDFRSEEKEWNSLTMKILNDETVNHKLGLLIGTEELNDNLAKELTEKGIVNITVGNNEDCRSVEYQKNRENSIGTQYLKWTTCENVKTKKGYYENLEPIEVFGIGNGWMTWIDIDPI